MCNAMLRNHIEDLQQTKLSAIRTYANIPRVDRFCQFFVRLVSFILERKRSIALSVRQSFSPSPQTWYFKTHYLSLLLYGITLWYESSRFFYKSWKSYAISLVSCRFIQLRSRTPFYPCMNWKSFLVIRQTFFSKKDYFLAYWGIHRSQKDQIRLPNLKEIICRPKWCNRKYKLVFLIKS